jgi:hypothetical protein
MGKSSIAMGVPTVVDIIVCFIAFSYCEPGSASLQNVLAAN